MKIIKSIVMGMLFIFICLALGVTGALLLVDDKTIFDQAFRQIESSTGTHISYKEGASLTRTLSPMITITDLNIEDPTTHQKFHTRLFELQISLPGLLKGNLEILKLVLGDTRVELNEGDGAGKLNLPRPFPLKPIFHDIRISQVSIFRANEKISLPAIDIKKLTVENEPGTDTLICNLQAQVGDDMLNVMATLPRVQTILEQQHLPFTFKAAVPYSHLSAEGLMDFRVSPPTLEARVQAEVPDLTQIPQMKEKPFISGELSGQARITGTFDQLAMEDLSAVWKQSQHTNAQLTGRIGNIFSLTGFDFNLNGALVNPNFPAAVLPESLDPIKRITHSARISGAYPKLAVQAVRLNLKTVKELDLDIAGRLDLTENNAGFQVENMDFKLNFSAPNTRTARVLFFDTIPEFGAVQGQAEIRSKKGHPSLENIIVQTLDARGIQVDLKGRIDAFPFDPAISNSGYDLDVTMTSNQTSVMGKTVGIELPVKGPLDITYRIEGDTQALRLEKIDFSAGEKNEVRMGASGRILFGRWDQTDPIEHIDLAVRLKSKNTLALGNGIGKQLPEMGMITAWARLHTVSETHKIDDIQVRIKKNKLMEIAANGSAEQVILFPSPAVKGITLSATASGDTASLLTDIAHVKGVGPISSRFKASANIFQNDQTFGIQDLLFAAGLDDGKDQPSNLVIKGGMADINNFDTLSLDAGLVARDLKRIGSLLGQDWPEIGPVELSSSILKKKDGIHFDAVMTAGETKVHAIARSISHRGTPYINGKITAQKLILPNLLEKKNKPAQKNPPGGHSFFSRSPLELNWLKKADMDLLVDIASFDQETTNLESAQCRIGLESGRLSVESARLVYPKGEVKLDLHLELEKDLKIRLKASGESINPWMALSMEQTKHKNTFDTELDIDVDITSFGTSEYELLANMDGGVYIILKNGKMRKELLDMLFIDLVGWTLSKTIGNKYVDINCGVGDYRISKGVINTNAFFIDTNNITVAGKGTIDLAQEKIDCVFLPKKKSRLIGSAEPVKVTGPLNNPSVKVLPWKSAASTYGSLFFGPYVFAGVTAFNFLTGLFEKGGDTSPCLEYEKKHAPAAKQDRAESTP